MGDKRLNRIVPPTSETSAASVKAMPATWSTPPLSRLPTTKATPPTPSTRPIALRHVIRSSRNVAASTAVNTGLALMTSADRPDEMLFRPI